MGNINRNKVINIFATTLAGAISVFATFCTVSRFSDINGDLSVQMLASSLSMPQSVVANTVSNDSKYKAVTATQPPTTSTTMATENETEKENGTSEDEKTENQ